MRALVTGGAGFIGSHLVERLHREDFDLLVVDNLASGDARLDLLTRLDVPVNRASIQDESFPEIVREFRPEVVFHLAAQSGVPKSVANPILDAEVNVIGLLRALESASSVGARFIFASSGGTIYGNAPLPPSEDVLGRPTSPYGITKGVGEDYIRFFAETHGLKFVSLALANVYGPRQDAHGEGNVVAIFANRLIAGDRCTIFGDGKQTRDFVYVSDVVDAFVAAIRKGDGETINIGSGVETTIEDLYWQMARLCDVDAPPEFGPERAGDLRRNFLDVRKAKAVLGWELTVSLSEGLTRTIEAFRSQGS